MYLFRPKVKRNVLGVNPNLRGVDRGVGSLYGINTFGAVAGCLLTGFFFIASCPVIAETSRCFSYTLGG